MLGLLDKHVTGPLWRLCESDLHIIDFGAQYPILMAWLGACIADSSHFLQGASPSFNNAALRLGVDSSLASLLANDPTVDQYLPLIIKQVLQMAQRFFELSRSDYNLRCFTDHCCVAQFYWLSLGTKA
uniref:Uncharacterized protein n=1 Tax=Plectus sambesii TaxID=2011161 RepID=A0A914VFW9_9BILA